MKRPKVFLKISAAALAFGTTSAILAVAPAGAQSFHTYHCADGTEFVVGFYPYDSRAFMQIDGRSITLPRRLTLSGTRYSSGDVTLKVPRNGAATIRHARRREAACELY